LQYTSTLAIDGKPAYAFIWNGQPAYIFFRNELTKDLWDHRVERTMLWEWITTAEPQDRVAMSELIVQRTGSGYQAFVYSIPQFAGGEITGWRVYKLPWPDLAQIEIEIRKLSVPALRELNGLISAGDRPGVGCPLKEGAREHAAHSESPRVASSVKATA
jgi:hypothetical protein